MYGCISARAAEFPDEAAVTELDRDGAERTVTWRQLRSHTDALAAYMAKLGVGESSRVAVAMPNSIETVLATLAVWRLGACVFLLSHELVPDERRTLLGQIDPVLLLSSWKNLDRPMLNVTEKLISELPESDGSELPDLVSCPGKALATGGSTGVPKIIIDREPIAFGEDDFSRWGYITALGSGQTQLVCGSLHHSLFNNSFYLAMAMGNTNVLLRHFDEALVLKAVEKYAVNCLVLVPAMMSRVLRCPSREKTDLSSLNCLLHAGASCPTWLKKDWINILGPEKVREFYSMSEKVGLTYIRGDEWLLHEGSVGRAIGAELEILDDEGRPVPNGTVGNVYFKNSVTGGSANYLLRDQKLTTSADNAVSVGDLGRLDDDGYLYLADRRSDMILTGGKNVYAAEVENVLHEYPHVRDIVVIGLSDPTWGRKVHAIIEPDCTRKEFGLYEFADFGFRKASNYKLPKTIELVERIPRDESGKLRRGLLVDERENTPDAAKKFGFINVPNGHQILAWRRKRAAK